MSDPRAGRGQGRTPSGLLELGIWIIECIPGAFLIGIMLLPVTAMVLDFEIVWQDLGRLLLQFLPGFVAGLLIVMTISRFLGALLRRLLALVGIARRES